MNFSKPKVFGPVRPTCPVCGQTTYSQGGIHPQCAVNRADQADRVVLKARNAALATQPKAQSKTRWTKGCPRCHHEVHVRLATCGCGYSFQPKRAG